MQQRMNPNVTKVPLACMQGTVQELMNYHDHLEHHPELRASFEAAVQLGLGGTFVPEGLQSTYMKHGVMPSVSQYQAMLFLVQNSVEQWCAAQPEMTPQLTSFRRDVGAICQRAEQRALTMCTNPPQQGCAR